MWTLAPIFSGALFLADLLKRTIHEEGQFHAAVIETTRLGRHLFQRFKPSPIGLQLMTQAMTGALLLVSRIKGDGVLSLRFEGNGPAGELVVEANTQGHVRGFLGDPNLHFEPKPDAGLFQQALGSGTLRVRRITEPTRKMFESLVPLVEGELSENLGHFLLTSEQVHAAIQLGALLDPDLGVKASGGILIQALPDANPHVLTILEDRMRTMPAMGSLLREADGPQKINDLLFEGLATKALDEMPVTFQCSCNKKKVLQIVSALPEEDLKKMMEEGRPVTVQCHFCSEPYTCTPADLAAVADLRKRTSARQSPHPDEPE